MTINGETFEVIKPRKFDVRKAIERLSRNTRKDLYAHYEKPSKKKIEIWHNWLDWALETPVDCFNVTSANTQQFTIEGVLYDEETGEDIGLICITKSHNRLYLIN